MLVLTQRVNESVRVGEASIRVLKIEGGQVSIGIDAPRHVNILRDNARKRTPNRDNRRAPGRGVRA